MTRLILSILALLAAMAASAYMGAHGLADLVANTLEAVCR